MKHTEIASELFSKRYYCSQAVLAAFAEELGMTKKQALRVAACFGGGMCKAEVCGACTGALMALGLKYGMCEDGDLDSKERETAMPFVFLTNLQSRTARISAVSCLTAIFPPMRAIHMQGQRCCLQRNVPR